MRAFADHRPSAYSPARLSSHPGSTRRRRAIWIGLAGLVLVTVVTAVVTRIGASPHTAATQAPASPLTVAPAPLQSASPGLTWHTSVTVAAAGSPVQQQYDQAFAQGLGSQPGMTAAVGLTTPAPAIDGGWPKLNTADTPDAWAEEFVAGLLDVNFTSASRDALGAWLQAQEAPELLPGVPTTAADKMLYVSLLDPSLFGGQATPLPSAAAWSRNGVAGTRQAVGDLLIQPDPGWAQMIAAGWQPADPRMAELDVSGQLTTFTGGERVVRNFSLQLTVGSARWHDGYGTVTVADWKES